MTDDDLRRSCVRRSRGTSATCIRAARRPAPMPPWRAHPSFGKFLVPRGDEEGGPCLIEPTVHCNHCGFCQSYGH